MGSTILEKTRDMLKMYAGKITIKFKARESVTMLRECWSGITRKTTPNEEIREGNSTRAMYTGQRKWKKIRNK